MSRGPRKSKEVREAEAQNHELYAMKKSEDSPKRDIYCSVCDERKSWGQFMPGTPTVCCDCAAIKYGRATPAECPAGSPAMGQKAQLALFEN